LYDMLEADPLPSERAASSVLPAFVPVARVGAVCLCC